MNPSVYSVIKDFVFLRNMGQLYFILLVMAVFLLITFGFSKKIFQ